MNGFYNEKKHGEDTLSLGVNECEKQINHVVKIAISKIIQDLITLKRNNLQQLPSRHLVKTLAGEEIKLTMVSQKNQLFQNLNQSLENPNNNVFKEAKLRQEGSMGKHSLQLLCMDNVMQYN